jgi:hypothetical protein
MALEYCPQSGRQSYRFAWTLHTFRSEALALFLHNSAYFHLARAKIAATHTRILAKQVVLAAVPRF